MRTMNSPEQAIEGLIQTAQDRIRRNWVGHERTLLIELVRSLDHIAFAFCMAPNAVNLRRFDAARQYMLKGAAMALSPLLAAIKDQPGNVPWEPTNARMTCIADQYLLHCGQLAYAKRLVEAARYGLAEATLVHEKLLVIEVAADDGEVSDRSAGAWLTAHMQQSPEVDELVARKRQSRKSIDRYIGIDRGWFVRYDPDARSLLYHHKLAAVRARGIAEGEALPPETLLGGQSFKRWNDAAVAAQGRVLHHVACATRLLATNRQLDLRNLLTVYSRRDDITRVWREAGEDVQRIPTIMSLLTLNAETAAACQENHEIPLPYYVDFGRDFVLLPSFGALLNPCAGLVWNLRKAYRSDWDHGVDGREAVFRDDLQRAFPVPRYEIPQKGFDLYRTNGEKLTDLDAVIIDRHSGALALVQLKWHDIFGRSLRERNSRRLNLVEANKWVGKVADWTSGRSASDVAAALNIGPAASEEAPKLIVVARHAARFTGEEALDERAAWISWPELMKASAQCEKADVLASICRDYQGGGPAINISNVPSQTFQFPEMTVEIRGS